MNLTSPNLFPSLQNDNQLNITGIVCKAKRELMALETPTFDNEQDSLNLRVDSAIQKHPHLRGLSIQPQTDGDSIVLRGKVDSFFIKQMAQEAARSVEGADKVDNQIEVCW